MGGFIIPKPQVFNQGEGTFLLNAEMKIVSDKTFEHEAEILKSYLQENLQLKSAIEISNNLATKSINIIAYKDGVEISNLLKKHGLQFTETMRDEGYVLIVEKEQISLIAATGQGAFYAVQTLRALIKKHGKTIPAVAIQDWPDMKMRGITDDFSRGQVSTMANFKKIIRFLAEHKMNVYMPYMEDLFVLKSYPTIGVKRGAMTADEWIDLQDYAEGLHVEIIPIFQTLGHYENILIQPEFMDMAEFPGAASLNINSEKTYPFLEKALAEIIPVFRSKYFHIGADESWDVGRFATKADANRIGKGSLHARHYRRVFDMVKKYGKQVMMYGDIVLQHPEILNEIPDDVIMFDWHYYPRGNYKSTETFSKAGQPFVVSAGVHNWRNFFPNYTNALSNIRHLTRDGHKNGAIGSITSNWGDYGAMNLRELIYYPHTYSAAVSWNVEGTDFKEFDQAFYFDFFGDDDPAYALVFDALNNLIQHEEWLTMVGHPFYPLPENKIKQLRQAAEMDRFASQIIRQIERLKPTQNADNLDYFKLSAAFYGWYGRLAALKIAMAELDLDLTVDKTEGAKKLRLDAINLALALNKLNKEYARLWKRENRPDNLQRMTELWDRVEKYLLIKADEILAGNLSFNGQLGTPFITFPYQDEKSSVPSTYLRQSFNLKKIPQKAMVQMIANSHGQLWLNGKKVGASYARKSLSALVEKERVKDWDVTKFLKKGQNVIAVKVQNYTSGLASANIWLQVKTNKGWQNPITADVYWKAANKEFKGWEKGNFDDSHWPNAMDAKRNWIISKPYFEYELPSRIEFYSGRGK